jgi:hypothetical protein
MELDMIKRFAGRGNRRVAGPGRMQTPLRRTRELGCEVEIRESNLDGDDQAWLTPQGLVKMYPLVGALLAELKKTERRERGFRLRRA